MSMILDMGTKPAGLAVKTFGFGSMGNTVYLGDYEISREHLGAHNDYLRFFIEAGVAGTLTYFLPYFLLLFHAFKYQRFKASMIVNKIAKFFACFMPAILVMSFTENLAGYVVVHWDIWALMGIYLSCIHLAERGERQKEQSHE